MFPENVADFCLSKKDCAAKKRLFAICSLFMEIASVL